MNDAIVWRLQLGTMRAQCVQEGESYVIQVRDEQERGWSTVIEDLSDWYRPLLEILRGRLALVRALVK